MPTATELKIDPIQSKIDGLQSKISVLNDEIASANNEYSYYANAIASANVVVAGALAPSAFVRSADALSSCEV